MNVLCDISPHSEGHSMNSVCVPAAVALWVTLPLFAKCASVFPAALMVVVGIDADVVVDTKFDVVGGSFMTGIGVVMARCVVVWSVTVGFTLAVLMGLGFVPGSVVAKAVAVADIVVGANFVAELNVVACGVVSKVVADNGVVSNVVADNAVDFVADRLSVVVGSVDTNVVMVECDVFGARVVANSVAVGLRVVLVRVVPADIIFTAACSGSILVVVVIVFVAIVVVVNGTAAMVVNAPKRCHLAKCFEKRSGC